MLSLANLEQLDAIGHRSVPHSVCPNTIVLRLSGPGTDSCTCPQPCTALAKVQVGAAFCLFPCSKSGGLGVFFLDVISAFQRIRIFSRIKRTTRFIESVEDLWTHLTDISFKFNRLYSCPPQPSSSTIISALHLPSPALDFI